MSPIDDLAAQLYGADAQKSIAAENPYTRWQGIPDALGGIINQYAATPHPGQPSDLGTIIGASAISGLLSGGFNQLGENYQVDKTKQYQDAFKTAVTGGDLSSSGLSPLLQQNLGNDVNMFKLKTDLGNQQAAQTAQIGLNKTIQAAIIEKKLKDGTLTPDDLAAAQAGKNVDLGAPVAGKNDALLNSLEIMDPEARKGLENASEDTVRFYAGMKDPAKAEDKITKGEDALRKAWEAKGIQEPLAATISLRNATEQLKKQNTPIGDLALAELFNRIQAPGANAIRGSVLDKTLDAQNPLNKVQGEVQQFMGGGSMNPESRKQLVDAINLVSNERLNYYKSLADSKFKTIADTRGLNFNSVIPEYDTMFGSLDPSAAPGVGTSPTGGSLPTVGSSFNGEKVLSVKKIN